jgi:transposase-like protein
MSEKEAQLHPVIAVRVRPDLCAWADEQAAIEGISRSDVLRRALIRDRQRQLAEEGAVR